MTTMQRNGQRSNCEFTYLSSNRGEISTGNVAEIFETSKSIACDVPLQKPPIECSPSHHQLYSIKYSNAQVLSEILSTNQHSGFSKVNFFLQEKYLRNNTLSNKWDQSGIHQSILKTGLGLSVSLTIRLLTQREVSKKSPPGRMERPKQAGELFSLKEISHSLNNLSDCH